VGDGAAEALMGRTTWPFLAKALPSGLEAGPEARRIYFVKGHGGVHGWAKDTMSLRLFSFETSRFWIMDRA
jgi:hypothetical protein